MRKGSNKKHRLAIGAVVAAGVTTGAMAAGMTPDAAAQSNPEVQFTAADRVVVDGQSVDFDQMLALSTPQVRDHVARPMYGVRKPLVYGPRPRVYGPRPPVRKDTVQVQDTIATRVIALTATQAKVDPKTINLKSELVRDLGMDSLGVVELLITIEREFNLVIPDETLDKMRTVEDIIKFIKQTR